MNKRGLTAIVVLFVIVAAVIVIGGIFYYARPAVAPTTPVNGGSDTGQSTTTANPVSLPSPTPSSTPIIPPKVLFSLSPQSGSVGTEVTIHGSGFGTTNTIEMNGLVGASMKNVASVEGKTLSFRVPSTLGPNCNPNQMCAQFLLEVTPNTYAVTVITNGATKKIGTFTVTAK